VVRDLWRLPEVRRLGPDEALSVARSALLAAAGRYDEGLGRASFKTFAYQTVYRVVLRAARHGGGLIHVPHYLQTARSAAAAPEAYRRAAALARRVASLAAAGGDWPDPPAAAPAPAPSELAELEDLVRAAGLSPAESLVVELRFFRGLKNARCAPWLDLSASQCSRLTASALAKLRQKARAERGRDA
jgi:RNA polymerase sigma factor (sigma-70 family)